MVVGAFYALQIGDGNDCVRVMLKSLEARYPSKVIVMPPHSEDDDVGIEVSTALIKSTWEEYVAENLELEDTAAFWDVLWIPNQGDKVELKGTNALEWTMVDISFADGEGWAVVRSEIFGQPQEQTVAITQLRRPRPVDAEAVGAMEANFADEGRAPLRWDSSDVHSTDLLPVEPVHNLQPETVAPRLVFSEAACKRFHRMSWCREGREEARMRAEVAKWGYIGALWQPGRYVQYVVPGRFEFSFEEDPRTVEGDLWVEDILDIRSDKAKAKFERERRAKRRHRTNAKEQGRSNSDGSTPGRKRRRNRRRSPNS